MRAGSRLLNSAIDSALSNIWPIIGGAASSAITMVLVALILYLRTPQSAWLYAVLRYGLAFMGGFLVFAMILVGLALLGVRRRRAQAESGKQRYVSTEKGPMDYRAELKPAIKSFQSVTTEMGAQLRMVGTRSGKIAKRIVWLDRISPALSLRSASKGADVLNKHAGKIERLAVRLEEKSAAFLEVSQGVLKSAPPASAGNKAQLTGVQESVEVMDALVSNVITTQGDFRDKAMAVHGTSCMALNTSMNRLIAVTEENIRILNDFKTKMRVNLVPLLQKKLSS